LVGVVQFAKTYGMSKLIPYRFANRYMLRYEKPCILKGKGTRRLSVPCLAKTAHALKT